MKKKAKKLKAIKKLVENFSGGQSKATIFNNLIVKMVKADKIYQTEIISN